MDSEIGPRGKGVGNYPLAGEKRLKSLLSYKSTFWVTFSGKVNRFSRSFDGMIFAFG